MDGLGRAKQDARAESNAGAVAVKEPFMSLAHVLLNSICIQVDPPPEGGGFTDPLYEDSKSTLPSASLNYCAPLLGDHVA